VPTHDRTVLLEVLERSTERRAGDSQLRGQLDLRGKLRSRRVGAVSDLRTQQLLRLKMERRFQ
jgi:hypothetical protein